MADRSAGGLVRRHGRGADRWHRVPGACDRGGVHRPWRPRPVLEDEMDDLRRRPPLHHSRLGSCDPTRSKRCTGCRESTLPSLGREETVPRSASPRPSSCCTRWTSSRSGSRNDAASRPATQALRNRTGPDPRQLRARSASQPLAPLPAGSTRPSASSVASSISASSLSVRARMRVWRAPFGIARI